MEKEEDEDTCVSILKDKAEKTSLHGIGHIVQCRHRYQQTLWTLLVLGLVGFLAYQLNDLFSQFMDHPVKTSVSMEFTHLHFPAVSFCNMNPVRNSMKGKIESEQLKRILTVRSLSYFRATSCLLILISLVFFSPRDHIHVPYDECFLEATIRSTALCSCGCWQS